MGPGRTGGTGVPAATKASAGDGGSGPAGDRPPAAIGMAPAPCTDGSGTCASKKQGFVVGEIWGDSSVTTYPVLVDKKCCS